MDPVTREEVGSEGRRGVETSDVEISRGEKGDENSCDYNYCQIGDPAKKGSRKSLAFLALRTGGLGESWSCNSRGV